jgi:hypothetical protein
MVPVVILPRYASFAGPGSYATAPLPVEAFVRGVVTFWRGPLVGGVTPDPPDTYPFTAVFEESHDAVAWTEVQTVDPFHDADASEKVVLPFHKRWLRVRVELVGDANNVVAISMWIAGLMEMRIAES